MLGRVLRMTGAVLAVAVAFVTPVFTMSAPASADTVIEGCTIVANPTPTNFTNCPGVQLNGNADFTGLNLSYANFAGANIVGSSFAGANLSYANFVDAGLGLGSASGADLSNANLSGAGVLGEDLSNANLSSANLTGTRLAGCVLIPSFLIACLNSDLNGAELVQANLTDAAFAACNAGGGFAAACGGADLSGADLSGATVTGATFSACLSGTCAGATLTGANLTGTLLVPSGQIVIAADGIDAVVTWPTPPSLQGATPGTCTPPSGSTFPLGPTAVTCQVLDDQGDVATGTFAVTVLRQISQISIPCTKLAGCDLSGFDLSYTILAKADLHGADLTDANLSGANLTKARLQGADLVKANLSGANLTKANLQDANVNTVTWGIGTICPDGTNVNSTIDGGSCVGHLVPR